MARTLPRQIRPVLSVIAVAALGFVLANVVFIIDAVYQRSILFFLSVVYPAGMFTADQPPPPFLHASFLLFFAAATWSVFRRNIPVIFRAAWLTVFFAASYITVGLYTFEYPGVSPVAGIITGLILFTGVRKCTDHWLYTASWCIATAAMMIGVITGTEI